MSSPTEPASTVLISPPAVRTFLITDVRGYTRFTMEQGDEAAVRLVEVFTRLVRRVIEEHGGGVLELRGDEALCVFTSTRQAVRAAVALQVVVAEHSLHTPELPVPIGVGLDAGEALPFEGGYRGTALNLAARLCSLAAPGEVLASDAVVHLAGPVPELAYADRGETYLKGFADPVHVSELRPVSRAGTSPQEPAGVPAVPRLPIGGFLGALPAGPMAGREEELEQLLGLLQAAGDGHGRVTLLVGEAGVGKTRLAQELSLLARNQGWVVGTGRSSSTRRDIALAPWVEAVTAIVETVPPAVKSELARRWPALQSLVPDVLGASPGSRQPDTLQTFRAVAGALQSLAAVTPIALLIDDLPQADPASIQLVQYLGEHTAGERIFLLVTAEEGQLQGVTALTSQLAREHLLTRVPLRRLSSAGTGAMVAASMGQSAASEEFADYVHRRTRGTPRHIDEMVRALGGRLTLVREIGAGGMGRVFEAIDRVTGQRVAAKILFARGEIELDALVRFQQEGAVLSTLKHPQIVEVYGAFLEEHASCIIMELLHGLSLGQLMAERELSMARIQDIMTQVLDALAFAHGRKIVHRDIKPDNIMVSASEGVKVTDFGIARIVRPETTVATMASTGMTLGTPLYMAPEQIEAKRVDHRADLYSVGAVLYHLVTGRPPFEGHDAISVALKHVNEAPAPPRKLDPAIPRDWEALVLKALAKDPGKRYQSAGEMREALAKLTASEEPRSVRGAARLALTPDGTEALSHVTPSPVPARRTPPWQVTTPLQGRSQQVIRWLRRRWQLAAIPLVALVVVLGALVVHSITTPHVIGQIGRPVVGWGMPTTPQPVHFSSPSDVATDASGNVFIADAGNHRIVELGPQGDVKRVYATTGLEELATIAVSASGAIYAGDAAGLGRAGLWTSIPRNAAHGYFPQPAPGFVALAADARGRLYGLISGNLPYIDEYAVSSHALRLKTSIATGVRDICESDVAVDAVGNIFFAARQCSDQRVSVEEWSRSSRRVHTWSLLGDANIAVDDGDDIYLADSGTHSIRVYSRAGALLHAWSSPNLSSPTGIAVDRLGNVWVVDQQEDRVLKVSSTGAVTTQTAQAGAASSTIHPAHLAVGPTGMVFVSDAEAARVYDYRADGRRIRAWGKLGSGSSEFGADAALFVDASNHIDVLNWPKVQRFNVTGRFEEWTSPPGMISLAPQTGGGLVGESPTSSLFYPTDSPRDALQEADWTGKVLGHFGIKCFSTECSPSKGQIQHAGQVVVDARGNVYVLDVSAPAVIKFSRSGSVLSVVGKGGTAPGEFTGPQGVALDTAGNIYVADTGNNRIQKFSPDGQLLAVTGKPGTKPGEFNTPTDIGVDREGNVYVLDSGNNRIQKFVPGT